MRRLFIAAACALPAAAWAQAETFEQVQSKAMAGDYQAQRNVAFGYTSLPYKGQDKNPMLGCAWRLVIIKSGSPRVDQTDINNVRTYCGELDELQRSAAIEQARRLYRQIYRREMR